MGNVYTKSDLRCGFAEQTVWGTAEADAIAVKELVADIIEVPQSVNIRKAGGAHATRSPLSADYTADQLLAAPEITVKGWAKQAELDFFLYGLFQKVTEGATTPFSKTFIFDVTQPDFATSNAGSTLTAFLRDPVAADSWKVKDVITKSLTLGCKPGDHLQMTAELIGRGAPATATPSGTWARTAETFWNFASLARSTVNFGAGAQSLILKEFQIKLLNEIVLVGQSAGDFQNYGLVRRTGTFSIKAVKDANLPTAITNLKAGTVNTFNLGWGNASAGTVDGDLDITFTGKLTDVKHEYDELYGYELVGDMTTPNITTSICTVIMANAIDRVW